MKSGRVRQNRRLDGGGHRLRRRERESRLCGANGPGHYTITFTCAAANCYFHKGYNTDSIVAVASAETGHFCIASAIVDSVGNGQIVVELSTWRVDSLIEMDNNVAVLLFEA